MGVVSLESIPAGEELFANYGYGFDMAPRWYRDLFLKHMDEHPEDEFAIRKISAHRTKAQLEAA